MAKDARLKGQFNFLEAYIFQVLRESGLNLSESGQKIYLPQIAAEAEYRLGLALIPKLNKQQSEEMTRMFGSSDATPEEWLGFWKKAVPDFDVIVKNELEKFSKDIKQILSK